MLRLRIGLRSGSPVRVLAPRYERNERDSRVLKLSVLLLSHLACASAKLEPIATDVACGLCVFLLVTTMSCAKTAEPVEVLIGCGLTNYFLDEQRAKVIGGHTGRAVPQWAHERHQNYFYRSGVARYCCLQCFDAVGWAAGRASGL